MEQACCWACYLLVCATAVSAVQLLVTCPQVTVTLGLISRYLIFGDVNSRSQVKYQLLMFVRPSRPGPSHFLSQSFSSHLRPTPTPNPRLRQDKLWCLKYLLSRAEQTASVSALRGRVQIQVLRADLGSLEK